MRDPVQLTDIADLVPPGATAIADLRCGDGSLGALLAERNPDVHVTGVEPHGALARAATQVLAEVLTGRPETIALPFRPRSLDCVVALDALEQAADPWKLAAQILGWLKPGGTLIVEVANALCASFLTTGLAGDWTYANGSALERDRMRFFTRASITGLLVEAGFDVATVVAVPDPASRAADGGGPEVFGTVEGADSQVVEDLGTAGFVLVATKPRAAAPVVRRSISVDVSVIVAAHNAAADVGRLVDSLATREQDATLEVVLVDNGSTDALAQFSSPDTGNIKVVRNIADLGMTRGFAQGAAVAKGRCLFFVDPSTIVHEECLGSLIVAFDNDAKLGAVGPVVLDPAGAVLSAGWSVADEGGAISLRPLHAGESWDADRTRDAGEGREGGGIGWAASRHEVDALGDSAFAVRRTVFQSQGGFDLALKGGCFAADFCLRIRDAGWKVACEPAAVVTWTAPPAPAAADGGQSPGVLSARARLSQGWSGRLPTR